MAITEAYRAGHDGRPGWSIAFGYDEALIGQLKAAIPASHRSYDPDTHRWWISLDWEDTLLGLMPSFEAHLRQGSLL